MDSVSPSYDSLLIILLNGSSIKTVIVTRDRIIRAQVIEISEKTRRVSIVCVALVLISMRPRQKCVAAKESAIRSACRKSCGIIVWVRVTIGGRIRPSSVAF